MCVFVCSKVLVTAVIDPPTAPPTSRVSHPGLLLGGAVWSQLLWGWAPTVVELADYNK